MTDLAELVVRIKADATQLQQELQRTNQSVSQSTSSMGKSIETLKDQLLELAPAFTAVALAEFGKSALESAANIYDLAERIGFTGSTLSALNIPLKQNGSSVEEFAAAVNILNRNIGLAATGNQEMIQKFNDLGLSVTKLKSLHPEEAFFDVVEALGQTKDQFELANTARDLFGRGVAGLLPIIKETGGNLRDFADNAKQAGTAISDEDLARIHQFEASWVEAVEKLKLSMVNAVPALQLYLNGLRGILDLPQNAFNAGHDLANALGIAGNPNVSYTRPQTVDTAETGPSAAAKINAALRARGLPGANGAAGSNSDILGTTDATTQATKDADSALDQFIKNLQTESTAIGESQRALAIDRAEIEATTKAKEDFNNGLRDSKDLTDEEKTQIDSLAGSYYDLKQAQEESSRVAKEMQDAFANSISQVITDFHSLKSAVASVMQAIANEIIRTQISQPLASSLAGSIPGLGGLFSGLFGGNTSAAAPITSVSVSDLPAFAGGGTPPIGTPSLVGENGPELFVPNSAGTIVPNNKLGGGVSVTNVFNISPGLAETVNAAIANAAPTIRDSAINGTLTAIQRGGSAAKLVGKKS